MKDEKIRSKSIKWSAYLGTFLFISYSLISSGRILSLNPIIETECFPIFSFTYNICNIPARVVCIFFKLKFSELTFSHIYVARYFLFQNSFNLQLNYSHRADVKVTVKKSRFEALGPWPLAFFKAWFITFVMKFQNFAFLAQSQSFRCDFFIWSESLANAVAKDRKDIFSGSTQSVPSFSQVRCNIICSIYFELILYNNYKNTFIQIWISFYLE